MALVINPDLQGDNFHRQIDSGVSEHLDLVGGPSAVDAGLVCGVHVGVVGGSQDVSLLQLR